MPATLYVMEDVNLVCGDTGSEQAPGISTHLQINELKLPTIEENFYDHNAGGSYVGIEASSYIQKLETTFNLAGWNPDVMGMIARSNVRTLRRFTAYGLIRDKRTVQALQCVAVMDGQLGKIAPSAFRKGDMMQHEYSIRGITHYELYMQRVPGTEPQEIFWFDFFTSALRIGGVDVNDEMIRILAIPGVAI